VHPWRAKAGSPAKTQEKSCTAGDFATASNEANGYVTDHCRYLKRRYKQNGKMAYVWDIPLHRPYFKPYI